jgi:hypothetical protein
MHLPHRRGFAAGRGLLVFLFGFGALAAGGATLEPRQDVLWSVPNRAPQFQESGAGPQDPPAPDGGHTHSCDPCDAIFIQQIAAYPFISDVFTWAGLCVVHTLLGENSTMERGFRRKLF